MAVFDGYDVPSSAIFLELRLVPEKLNVLYKENWTSLVGEQLRKFEFTVVEATKKDGYDGKDLQDDDRQWSFSGALLYSVTVITTIGYGNIAPKTSVGKVMTIAYALIGVPLMLLCLSNIGSLMASTFQFGYSHCCTMFQGGQQQRTPHHHHAPDRGAGASSSGAAVSIRYTPWGKGDNHHQLAVLRELDQKPLLRLQDKKGRQLQPDGMSAKGGGLLLPRGHLPPSPVHLQGVAANARRNSCGSSSKSSSSSAAPPPPPLSPEVRKMLLECAEYNLSHEDSDSAKVVEELQRYEEREEVPCESSALDAGLPTVSLDAVNSSYPTPASLPPPPHMPPPPFPLPPPPEECECEMDSERTSSIYPDSSAQNTPSRVPLLRGGGKELHQHPLHLLPPPPPSLLVGREDEEDEEAVKIEMLSSAGTATTSASARQDGGGEEGEEEEEEEGEEEEEEEERVPVWLVLLFVVSYVCGGAVLFSYWEGWGYLDGAYFCFITLSTIGFGDLVPGPNTLRGSEGGEAHAQLVVCCVYLILGLAIIAMSFNLVQEEAIAKCKKIARAMGILDRPVSSPPTTAYHRPGTP